MSQGIGSKLTMKIVTIAVGIPVGIATKKAVTVIWKAARPDDPDKLANDPNVRWGDAIGWAALSAGGLVGAQLIKRRTAESTYRLLTGEEPPAPKAPKSEKKAAKQAKKAAKVKNKAAKKQVAAAT